MLFVFDAVYLRWVWIHFDHWGFWDWDYQQTLLEVARSAVVLHHQLPLWNPFVGGGVSLAGNTLNHVYAPSFLLILLFGTATGVKVCLPVYLAIAQLGMWRLSREWGQERIAAFLSAMVFTLGGVFAQRLTHGHFEWIAIAWMPYVLVQVHAGVRGANAGSNPRSNPRSIWLGAIALAFVFLDGGPYQFVLFSLFAIGYAATLGVGRRSLRPLEGLALIGGIGACLAAIKLLPMYELVMRYPRFTPADSAFYGAPFTPTASEILRQMFVSRAQQHDPELWMPYILNVGCYVGWLPLLLVAYAVARRPRKNALWAGLGLLLLMTALGAASPIDVWALLHQLPLMDSFRVPARFNVFVLMLLALLAGEGLQRLLETLREKADRGESSRRKRWPEAVAVTLVVLVGVDLVWVNGQVFRLAFSIPAIEIERRDDFAYYFESPYLERHRAAALFETHPNWHATFPAVLENRGVMQTYRTILSGRSVIPLDAREYKGEVWMENEAPGAIVAQHLTPNVLSVETRGRAGIVSFNVNYDPGWETTTAGVPDPIKLRGRLAIRLPAGTTHVSLRYRPRAFELGALVSGATIAIGLASAMRRRRAAD